MNFYEYSNVLVLLGRLLIFLFLAYYPSLPQRNGQKVNKIAPSRSRHLNPPLTPSDTSRRDAGVIISHASAEKNRRLRNHLYVPTRPRGATVFEWNFPYGVGGSWENVERTSSPRRRQQQRSRLTTRRLRPTERRIPGCTYNGFSARRPMKNHRFKH